jgi:hypothetical protein
MYLTVGSPYQRERWLASFTDWLPGHRSLVDDIRVVGTGAVAQQQFAALLRLCRLQAAADGLPPLRLQACTIQDVPMSALARELAAFNLQRLTVQEISEEVPSTYVSAFAGLLRQLPALRSLILETANDQSVPGGHALATDSVMAAVAHLTCLTYLSYGAFRPHCAAQLPPALQHLRVVVCDEPSSEAADIRHLTSLSRLFWSDRYDSAAGSELMLPSTLTSVGSLHT